MFTIPAGFYISRRAPFAEENVWLHDILDTKYAEYKNSNVLEFGSGITSLVLHQALRPNKHVAVEHFGKCVENTKKYIPDVDVVDKPEKIEKILYSVILVDSSYGIGDYIRTDRHPNKKNYGRDDSIKVGMNLAEDKHTFILHDINNGKTFYNSPMLYLEGNGYEMTDKFIRGRRGFGIYNKK